MDALRDLNRWTAVRIIEFRATECGIEIDQIGNVAGTVVFEKSGEFAVDARRFDFSVDVIDVSFTDDLPDGVVSF